MKKILAVLLCAAMVFSLAACGGGGDTSDPQTTESSNKLVVADSEWYGTDPYQNDTWSTIQSMIADTIFEIDPETGALIDGVATDLQISEDGLTMTFTIREGMYYATGEQVEPEDIKASLEHGAKVSPYADGYENIESIDVDGRQVTFHLTNFRSDLLYYLGECFIGIIDKDQLDTMTDEELMWGAVPYGMYYVESYEPGSYVSLKPNPGYSTADPNVTNKGPAKIDEVYVKFNTDDFTIIEELKNGTLDYWSGPTADAIAQLESASNVVVADKTYPCVDFMELNTNDSIFEDINLRKALCLLLDREKYTTFTNGAAKPEYAMIIPGMMYFSQAAEDDFKANYANNKEEALRLIAEAGWADTNGDGILDKDGKDFEFTMYASTDSTRQMIVQAMQADLETYGIRMNSEAIDWNYVHEYLRGDDYDAGIHSLEWLEPILILDCCFDDPNAANNNPEFYEAVDDAAATIDDLERADKLGEIQIELFKEWNMIPLYGDVSRIAYSTRIKNVNIQSNGFMDFNDWELE